MVATRFHLIREGEMPLPHLGGPTPYPTEAEIRASGIFRNPQFSYSGESVGFSSNTELDEYLPYPANQSASFAPWTTIGPVPLMNQLDQASGLPEQNMGLYPPEWGGISSYSPKLLLQGPGLSDLDWMVGEYELDFSSVSRLNGVTLNEGGIFSSVDMGLRGVWSSARGALITSGHMSNAIPERPLADYGILIEIQGDVVSFLNDPTGIIDNYPTSLDWNQVTPETADLVDVIRTSAWNQPILKNGTPFDVTPDGAVWYIASTERIANHEEQWWLKVPPYPNINLKRIAVNGAVSTFPFEDYAAYTTVVATPNNTVLVRGYYGDIREYSADGSWVANDSSGGGRMLGAGYQHTHTVNYSHYFTIHYGSGQWALYTAEEPPGVEMISLRRGGRSANHPRSGQFSVRRDNNTYW